MQCTFYAKFASLHQVCALAEPSGPWLLTFAPGWLEKSLDTVL